MQEAIARPLCEVSPVDLRAVDRVAAHFGVSRLAAAIRFAELSSEACAAVFCQERQVRWAATSASFPRGAVRGQQVDRDSAAFDYFSRGRLADEPVVLDPNVWIDGSRVQRAVDLIEHAAAVRGLSGVLSVLWLPDLVELGDDDGDLICSRVWSR